MSVLIEELKSTNELRGIFLDIDQKFLSGDFSEQLDHFVGELEKSEAECWDGRHTPGGESWVPLSEYTIRKKGHDVPLVLTGALREAMTNRDAPGHIGEVQPQFMTYGTDIDYAAVQNYGGGRIPQREFAGMDSDQLDKLTETIANRAVETLKYTTRG